MVRVEGLLVVRWPTPRPYPCCPPPLAPPPPSHPVPQVATPDQAQEMHATIRAWLAEHVGAGVAGATRVMYGGRRVCSAGKPRFLNFEVHA